MPDVKPRPIQGQKRSDIPAEIDSWLDRNSAADLLGCSKETLVNLEKRDRLHPKRTVRRDTVGAERMVWVYDPNELAAVSRKHRGGYDIRPPGEVAARCFELLDHGKSVREIVIELREMPEKIVELKEKWHDHGGADRVLSPPAWERLAILVGPFANIAELVARVEQLAAKVAGVAQPIEQP